MDTLVFLLKFIPYALLCYLICGIIHELGHVFTGLWHGWKLYMLVVGPIGIKRNDEDKLVLYLEKNPVMWGGVGGTVPVTENRGNLKIFSIILLGGPISSIIFGIVFSAICYYHFTLFLLLLGLMSISMGIVCLLPGKTGIGYTDGKRWRRFRNGGQGEAEETALFNMMQYYQFGKDKSLLKKEDFEALLDAKLPALRYYGYYYLFQYYNTHNDIENKSKILTILQDMKKDVPKIIIDDCKL